MDWSQVGARIRSAVIRIQTIYGEYDPVRPFSDPTENFETGSGFCVDAKKGWILTNGHIVANAHKISGQIPSFSREFFPIEVISISRENDLALCEAKFPPQFPVTELEFFDAISISEGTPVAAVGFPLDSTEVSFSTGIVSGFSQPVLKSDFSLGPQVEDALVRNPTFLQTSAPINPGNSGGPLVNSEGRVLGITTSGYPEAQGIGFAIPCWTVNAMFAGFLKDLVFLSPTWALEWSPSQSEDEGIRVRKIWPDSCLDGLETGDILQEISFPKALSIKDSVRPSSSFLGPSSSSTPTLKTPTLKTPTLKTPTLKTPSSSRRRITGRWDRFGDLEVLCSLKDRSGDFCETVPRKLSLAEVVDLIPIDSDFTLRILRNQKPITLTCKKEWVDSDRLVFIYPKWEDEVYLFTGGICWINLTLNLVASFPNLKRLIPTTGRRYQPAVVLAYMEPNSEAQQSQILSPGGLLSKVNGKRVVSVEEIPKSPTLTFEMMNGAIFTQK